ncbi:MAG TPA: hypothetical protein VF837_00490, partial [Patescibacteria group bacterium]
LKEQFFRAMIAHFLVFSFLVRCMVRRPASVKTVTGLTSALFKIVLLPQNIPGDLLKEQFFRAMIAHFLVFSFLVRCMKTVVFGISTLSNPHPRLAETVTGSAPALCSIFLIVVDSPKG